MTIQINNLFGRIGVACIAAILGVLATGQPASASFTTGNILTNPGFENSALTSDANVLGSPYSQNIWGDENSTIVGPTAGVTPSGGSYMLDMLTDGLTATQTFQLVDMTSYVSAADINSGLVTADFSGLFNVNNPAALGPGVAGVNIFFWDPTHTSTGTSPVVTGNISNLSWQPLSVNNFLVPANSQYIIAQVLYVNASMTDPNGVNYPGFVDDTLLTLTDKSNTPEPASCSLVAIAAGGALSARRRGRANA